jgi:hypothetical protein
MATSDVLRCQFNVPIQRSQEPSRPQGQTLTTDRRDPTGLDLEQSINWQTPLQRTSNFVRAEIRGIGTQWAVWKGSKAQCYDGRRGGGGTTTTTKCYCIYDQESDGTPMALGISKTTTATTQASSNITQQQQQVKKPHDGRITIEDHVHGAESHTPLLMRRM